MQAISKLGTSKQGSTLVDHCTVSELVAGSCSGAFRAAPPPAPAGGNCAFQASQRDSLPAAARCDGIASCKIESPARVPIKNLAITKALGVWSTSLSCSSPPRRPAGRGSESQGVVNDQASAFETLVTSSMPASPRAVNFLLRPRLDAAVNGPGCVPQESPVHCLSVFKPESF